MHTQSIWPVACVRGGEEVAQWECCTSTPTCLSVTTSPKVSPRHLLLLIIFLQVNFSLIIPWVIYYLCYSPLFNILHTPHAFCLYFLYNTMSVLHHLLFPRSPLQASVPVISRVLTFAPLLSSPLSTPSLFVFALSVSLLLPVCRCLSRSLRGYSTSVFDLEPG